MNPYELDILRLANQGYCCTQIVLLMALEVQGRENKGLVRAASGLCHGFPDAAGPCGAVGGAAFLLGYYAGKGTADEEEDERLPLMLSQLTEWFNDYCEKRYSGISCEQIVVGGQPDAGICGGLIADCYGQALTILVEHGFDPELTHDE